MFLRSQKQRIFVILDWFYNVFRSAYFSSNRLVVERLKLARGRKHIFSTFVENIKQNRRTHLPNPCRNVACCLTLPKDIRFFIFRCLANLGSSSFGSVRNFLPESKKSIFVDRNRFFEGRGRATNTRILNFSRVL